MLRVVAAGLIVLVLAALAALIRWHPALAYAISQEDSLLEIVQVLLCGGAGVFALTSTIARRRAGRPFVLDALAAAAMIALVIGEIDLDRQLFGMKVIHTRFFVKTDVALVVRALAFVVIVGVPLALALWAVRHRRALWRQATVAVREPWGQVFLAGGVIFAVAELFEKPLARATFAPRYSLEEGLELAAAIAFFLALGARQRTLSDIS
ncbi:MAG: hypothetical protein HYR51_20535 [Candidatus Rokubacteria bacterium]|nr:hypothetical protein [Candidatus Rokubacteria bacterium]